MVSEILAVATLNPASGIPKDAVVNTFSVVSAAGLNPTDGGHLTTLLTRFYANSTSVGHAVGDYLSDSVSRALSAHTWDLYDISGHLDGSPHGSPFFSDTFTLPAGAVSPVRMPSEAAIALTLRGTGWQTALANVPGPPAGPAGDTHPRARKSGRIFLGPLSATANASFVATGGEAVVNPTVVTAILDAIQDVQTQLVATTEQMSLAIWSRKAAGLTAISHAQVDNAFDTQRRRGIAATTRVTRAL